MMGAEPILAVEGLRKVYRSRRRGDIVAVDDVSFSVEPGEIVGILGPNGAGKTTTIKCMCTLITPTGGRIVVDGVDAVAQPRQAVRRVAAVLEGNRNVYWRMTVVENLEFFAALAGFARRDVRSTIDELIVRFGLQDKRDTEGRMLSRGMQQKLGVACAFVKGTPVLMLDEPTLGLDVETSLELRATLTSMAKEQGRTILLSSHDMDVVQAVCERVIIINDGRVITADQVSNLLELFRVRAYRFTVDGAIHAEAADALRSAFPRIVIEPSGQGTNVDVEFADASGFYELVDVLRRTGASIESVDRRDPNLGEIFLRIVKGEVAR